MTARARLGLVAAVRLLSAAVLCFSVAAAAESDLGAPLPDNARKVGEHRYRAATDWEFTMKWLKTAYPAGQYPRRAIVNQPGIKAIHVQNTTGKGQWDGLNVYQANDEVRIYVVPADGVGKKAGAKAP